MAASGGGQSSGAANKVVHSPRVDVEYRPVGPEHDLVGYLVEQRPEAALQLVAAADEALQARCLQVDVAAPGRDSDVHVHILKGSVAEHEANARKSVRGIEDGCRVPPLAGHRRERRSGVREHGDVVRLAQLVVRIEPAIVELVATRRVELQPSEAEIAQSPLEQRNLVRTAPRVAAAEDDEPAG